MALTSEDFTAAPQGRGELREEFFTVPPSYEGADTEYLGEMLYAWIDQAAAAVTEGEAAEKAWVYEKAYEHLLAEPTEASVSVTGVGSYTQDAPRRHFRERLSHWRGVYAAIAGTAHVPASVVVHPRPRWYG